MTSISDKKVYKFGNGSAEADRSMRDLLGGKGANLAEMSSIGLPVPPGFTISTESCRYYTESGGKWPDGLEEQVADGIRHLEETLDLKLGDPERPLLVSVRSGAAVSMPGMMDTVLNLGINDDVARGLARKTGNQKFAFDAYRRFIDMFGNVVMGVPHLRFERALEAVKEEAGVESDVDLDAEHLKDLVGRYKAIYRKYTGFMFPTDPQEQLRLSINAVFSSWDSERANKYRRINQIKGLIGTAVNVQAMVFGDMGETSGTGVCFTRNPSTGEHKLYGEYLIDAQGEDVVAGIRTPENISKLKEQLPEAYDELVHWTQKLEEHYQNMQDIEFTIQEGRLFILQTRNGKRTGTAAVKIAVDMVSEGLVSRRTAVEKLVEPRHLDQLMHPRFRNPKEFQDQVIGKGLPASPGAAVGQAVFSAVEAEKAQEDGRKVILIRIETSPEDVGGMDAAQGILTSRGGMTSHAAVVARGWGKPCVAGCGDIVVNYESGSFTNGHVTIKEGDWISIDGSTGQVIRGQQTLVPPKMGGDFDTFMQWVAEFQDMGVRTNADTPQDAERARTLGAVGIGLCRTEHMFFEGDRIIPMREMIMATSEEERRKALDQLLPFQKDDFTGIFRAMDGYPVTIRLLDPPLHEFLPHEEEGQKELAEALGINVEQVVAKVEALEELNPMLGHRGCRLGVTYPEITEMQTRAIIEAAVELQSEGVKVLPEIMVPLIGTVQEFENQKSVIQETAERVFAEKGSRIDYLVGTMIEIPRAALTADEVAREADFFSFGTNDLTQMTFGYSRDDAGRFLPEYVDRKILEEDPFQSIDIRGVGQLVKMGTSLGRSVKEDLKVGICGEHGGDPASVSFCYDVGMNYVSCSPFRVPIARLAAAQSRLTKEPADEAVAA
ncbi:MAG: pyruvate, phosphate dikinase [Rhodothermia bacterium]|nr:pyruvate, phosphate dikinase [Rhodothermia bacterium]